MEKTIINAKVIADSKNEFGNRLTSMVCTYPRIIHSEVMTHRMLSKNSASSRAIPFDKMVKSVQENPFIPIAWQKEHKGMQGSEYFTDEDTIGTLENQWLRARDYAVEQAKVLNRSINYPVREGVTKQLCNRLLEPFMWHTVIITASEWENFFALRCPQYTMIYTHNDEERNKTIYRSKKDLIKAENITDVNIDWFKMNKGQAEIHMMALAEAMYDAYNESEPKELKAGEWHIPFGDNMSFTDDFVKNQLILVPCKDEDKIHDEYYLNQIRIKIATARCARVSYTVVGEEGKEPNYTKDIELHDKLSTSGHWSCFEHCAKAMNEVEYTYNLRGQVSFKQDKDLQVFRETNSEGWSGNFKGFIQYRKMFDNENITK